MAKQNTHHHLAPEQYLLLLAFTISLWFSTHCRVTQVCISVITAVKKVMISLCFCLSVSTTMQAKYSNNFHKIR